MTTIIGHTSGANRFTSVDLNPLLSLFIHVVTLKRHSGYTILGTPWLSRWDYIVKILEGLRVMSRMPRGEG